MAIYVTFVPLNQVNIGYVRRSWERY